ncbi:hypothetical protein BDQ17DRAFT_1340979 [Cyathus striatus]|nr:hypothetical protein BDQ17DRAFT_1340979 [Cyathus striatus]
MNSTQLPSLVPDQSECALSCSNPREAYEPSNALRKGVTIDLSVSDVHEGGRDKISVHADTPSANVRGATEYKRSNADENKRNDRTGTCESQTSNEVEAVIDSVTLQRPNARVRFRSRVRITSGLNRSRHRNASFSIVEGTENSNRLPLSPASSLSGSPSSSISAPLRSRDDDEVGKPGWGTLGQRVGLFAQRRRIGDRSVGSPRINHIRPKHIASENTPLLRSPCRLSYETNPSETCEWDEEARLSKEIDLIFGTWPRRLLNHHWWWWHLEPIICCHCLEDSDTEE